MNENFKLSYYELVSIVSRFKLAKTQSSIEYLTKLVKKKYQELVQQTTNQTELDIVRKLKTIIVETYYDKQNLINRYINNQKAIREDSKINSSESEKIIKDFFNKPSDDSKTKNKKVYRTEELETQINEIFNSGTLLDSDGRINQTTQKLLLQRIYDTMNAIPTDKNTILRLVERVTKGQKQSDTNEEKTNSSEIKLVNGVDVAPACPPTDTDKERLKQKVAQLFQP